MENNQVNHFSIKSFFTLWRMAAFVLLTAISIRFSVDKLYNEMLVLMLGALFGPAQWVYLRDKHKGQEDSELDLAGANRWLIFAMCITGASLAYLSNSFLIASLAAVAGFGQFWFRYDLTSGERIWHGMSATVLAIIGYFKYPPLMFICLPLSIIFLIHQLALQKKEKEAKKAEANSKKSNNRNNKKKKKRKKK